jgi:hypothetical protein
MKYWLHWILTVGIVMATTACTLSLAMHPEFALWFMALAVGLYVVARVLHREDHSNTPRSQSGTTVAHT